MEEKHRYTTTYSLPNYKDRNNRPKRLKVFTEFPTLSLWQRLGELKVLDFSSSVSHLLYICCLVAY